MYLLSLRILSDASTNQFITFKISQIKFNGWIMVQFAFYTWEKGFDLLLQFVNQRNIKGVLVKGKISPKLKNFYFFYSGKVTFSFNLSSHIFRVTLWNFLSIFIQPIAFWVKFFKIKLPFYQLVKFFVPLIIESTN